MSEQDETALREVYERDPALREEIVEDLEMNGLLKAANEDPLEAEAFVNSFFERVKAEGDASRFIERVESRLQRRRNRGRERRFAARPVLAAAGVLAVAAVLSTRPRTDGRPPPARAELEPEPARPEAPPDVPAPRRGRRAQRSHWWGWRKGMWRSSTATCR